MTLPRTLGTPALALAIGVALLTADASAAPRRQPPLGRWSQQCSAGFRLSSMPTTWSIGPGQSVSVLTRLAVDFEVLPEKHYRVTRAPSGEADYDLQEFDSVVLMAEVRAAGSRKVIATLDGERLATHGSQPSLLTWNGLDQAGRPVPPGAYDLEIRGRLLPAASKYAVSDTITYRDLEGWSSAAEACTRSLRIEVVAQPVPGLAARATRAATCAAPPASYYASVDASTAATLRATLHPVIDDHVRFPYSSTSTDAWDLLNDADENPANAAQVLDLYKNETFAEGCSASCTWNREHTWAKSYGFPDETGSARTPYTDCHHLRATNNSYNSSRNNLPHDECTTGCSSYPTNVNAGFGGAGQDNLGTGGSVANGGTPVGNLTWETWDHRKGDVARSILYMDIRYEGGTGIEGAEPDLIATSDRSLMLTSGTYQPVAYHGVLSALLNWAAADPPDSDEIRRNNQVWCYQQNRNPFVDHPEWVACLYQGNCSGGNPGISFAGITAAADASACAVGGVNVAWSAPSAWNDNCSSGCSRGFQVLRNGATLASGGCAGSLASTATSCTDTSAVAGTTYTYSVRAFNHEGETSDGGASLSGTDRTNDGAAPVLSAVSATSSSSSSFTVTWTTNEPSDSRIEYGTTTAYGSSTSNATQVSSHSLTVSGLSAGTLYNYRVGSTDSCGVGPAWSANGTVTTQGGGGGGTPIDVSGWKITQANAAYTYTIPAGTTIPADGYLIIGRNATKASFQTAWGVTLASNVVYLNGADGMPVINGSETYTLSNAASVVIEGPTIAMASTAAQSVRRNDPCQAAGTTGSWTVGAIATATPGTGAGAGCGKGVVINEFADATSYVNEFIELHYDTAGGGDTIAPTTAITAPTAGATVSGTTVSVTATASDANGVTKVEFYLDGVLKSTDTTSPYAWTWDSTTATNASHSLQSKAYDAALNVGSSTPVSVTVNNLDGVAPTTSITAPTAGATVSGTTVSVTATASDAVGVTKVEFYLDGVLKSTDTTSPYAWTWDSTTATNASHSLQSKAYDAALNVGSSTPVSVTVNNPLGQTAVYDATLKAPKCGTVGSSCDTGASLILGRGTRGPEPNYSNTINASCVDGSSGTYHVDESLDRLKVTTTDGSALARGKTVRIEATVYAYSGYTSDKLDLYYAPSASSPVWTFIGTLSPTAGGTQTLTTTYTIPSTGTTSQAIRGQFRYQGTAGTCTAGSYNDRDDLVFAVN